MIFEDVSITPSIFSSKFNMHMRALRKENPASPRGKWGSYLLIESGHDVVLMDI
jgi:hypothetical protein